MKKINTLVLLISCCLSLKAQVFNRSELPTSVSVPWEIVYGPDNFLWISEAGGKVSRVDPVTGAKTVVYTAPDYFGGSTLESGTECFHPVIGSGTMGLALHPDFMNSATAYIYFVYSYNSGTIAAPATRFKIKRLTWSAVANAVVTDTDLITMITTGYDHLGGRLMAIKQGGIPYLFFTVGDHGISETNSPDCYSPASSNPNFLAQDPAAQNGKVHRFNMDGSIPADNPLPGNSFYTRGHRNPQGLMYNPNLDIIYDVEHGDRTDDEINVLKKGMNYGWKFVRGYHNDNNYPGEAAYIASYTPYPGIAGDSLVEAFYSFCATPQDTSSAYLDWCTVAPSDGIYYGSAAIPQWTNSLLVVTLKDGLTTDNELYQFKLQPDGQLVPSAPGNPNPKRFFGADQLLNGRLRDVAVSPDGKKIYLVNNYGPTADKITVYTYDSVASSVEEHAKSKALFLFPNPATDVLNIQVETDAQVQKVIIYNMLSQIVYSDEKKYQQINTASFKKGVYSVTLITNKGISTGKFLKE